MKKIGDIFEIREGDIFQMLGQGEIDTIVNSANESLMAGDGMDKVVHQKMNTKIVSGTFEDKIKLELDGHPVKADNTVRCRIGDAVITSGYGLCNRVVHTAGPYYDKTNSCMYKLERCYKSIINAVLNDAKIRRVAIPVISASNKAFSYNKALEIAIASIANNLIKIKRHHPAILEDIDKIYLVIYKPENNNYKKLLEKLNKSINKEELLFYRNDWEAEISYMHEIIKNDTDVRGVFYISKNISAFTYISTILLSCFSYNTKYS